ncbi:MAG: hypothetical protein AAF481_01550 [Acidobacteriota bacterium]
MTSSAMTDRQLLDAFGDGTIEPGSFHHRDHLRLTWLLLKEGSLLQVLDQLTSGLREFARAAGHAEHYHETITWAFVALIHQRMQVEKTADEEESADFPAFLRRNGDLVSEGVKVLERYYRPETLAAPLARQTFVLPDRGT